MATAANSDGIGHDSIGEDGGLQLSDVDARESSSGEMKRLPWPTPSSHDQFQYSVLAVRRPSLSSYLRPLAGSGPGHDDDDRPAGVDVGRTMPHLDAKAVGLEEHTDSVHALDLGRILRHVPHSLGEIHPEGALAGTQGPVDTSNHRLSHTIYLLCQTVDMIIASSLGLGIIIETAIYCAETKENLAVRISAAVFMVAAYQPPPCSLATDHQSYLWKKEN